ncbi:hypothetical protein EDC56_2974 [Sinobacterium caligoides]|uniref:Uncharacterized protein n=1 Tax=Sinobacterium caligoides TaxID=933926 RepID=A0A3N2DKM4_9GAMM|nr:hypothetical protein [Sinobacterium caligoides]ROS00328.1 hypothetical protein EDC56_2974 [Sinobacterium caligoides]
MIKVVKMAERHLILKQATSLGVSIVEEKNTEEYTAFMGAPEGMEFIYNSARDVWVSSSRGRYNKAYFWSEVKDVLDLGLQEPY